MSKTPRTRKLGAEAARRLVEKCESLGQADRNRLDVVLGLVDMDQRINLAEILEALYPEFDRKPAQTRLRQLRRAVRDAAKDAGVVLSLDVDTQKKNDPERRWCWFEGEDSSSEAATSFSAGAIRHNTTKERVEQQAMFFPAGRMEVGVFVSVVGPDDAVASLLDGLRVRSLNDATYAFSFWHRSQIRAGELRRMEVSKNLQGCHVHLVLLSHQFFDQEDLVRDELRPTQSAEDPKPLLLPALWEPMDLTRSSLLGLEQYKILFADAEDSFVDMEGKARRQYLDGILKELRSRMEAQTDGDWFEARGTFVQRQAAWFAERECLADPGDRVSWMTRHQVPAPMDFIPPLAQRASMRKQAGRSDEEGPQASQTSFDALNFLEEWATTPGWPHYFALLGDYGIGKTTTCEALSHRLVEAREEDDVPAVIYLDLRRLGDAARDEPPLLDVLERVLSKSWLDGRLD